MALVKLSTELDEIIAFAEAGITENGEIDGSVCIQRITVQSDEEFLMQRADGISQCFSSNERLRNAIGKVARICNEQEQRCCECPVKLYCNTYITNVRRLNRENSPKMVDLFCGAGGLSLGFCQEGFVPVLANDIEECCVDTYSHNHPEIPRDHVIQGDIREVVNELDELLRDQEIDIVVGGPPCQGFSMANRQRLIDDPRNYLYQNYVEIVRRSNPRFFVMENVKGMLSVAEQVVEDFRNIGYEVEYRVLNAADYGVPQNRERLIYIGNRIGISNREIFERVREQSKHIPNRTLSDAIESLRPLEASRQINSTETGSEQSGFRIERKRTTEENEYVNSINQNRQYTICLNHKARYNNDRDIEIFSRLEPGDKSDDPKIADIMPYTRRSGIFKDKYYKLQPDRVSKTITAHMKFDCNMYIHPSQARGLTPREAARIQSYPDDYYFRGSFTKTYMQIGNSVPPLLGRAIAHAIRGFI